MKFNPPSTSAFLLGLFYCIKPATAAIAFPGAPQLASALNILISFFIFGIAALPGLFNRLRFRIPRPTLISGLTATYCLWSLLSLFWTTTESKSASFLYVAGWIADGLTATLILGRSTVQRALLQYLTGVAIGAMVLSLIAFSYSGTMGDGRTGDELLHPNNLGKHLSLAAITTCALIAFLAKGTRHRALVYFALMIIVPGLLSTLSKTSILGFFVSFFILIITNRKRLQGLLLFSTVTIFLSLPLLRLLLDYILDYLSLNQGGIDTLSGRLILWEPTLQMIQLSPLLGYGVTSFRQIGPDVFDFIPPHAHNELFQQLFSTGMIGAGLTILIYLSAVVRWIGSLRDSSTNRSTGALGLSVMALVLIRGLTEAEYVGFIFLLPLLVFTSSNLKGPKPIVDNRPKDETI